MSKAMRAKEGNARDRAASASRKDSDASSFDNAHDVLGANPKVAAEKKDEREAEARLKKAKSQFYSLE